MFFHRTGNTNCEPVKKKKKDPVYYAYPSHRAQILLIKVSLVVLNSPSVILK